MLLERYPRVVRPPTFYPRLVHKSVHPVQSLLLFFQEDWLYSHGEVLRNQDRRLNAMLLIIKSQEEELKLVKEQLHNVTDMFQMISNFYK